MLFYLFELCCFLIFIFFFGCTPTNSSEATVDNSDTSAVTSSIISSDTLIKNYNAFKWRDSVVMNFIENSKNPIIVDARKDTMQWMTDFEVRGKDTLIRVQLGLSVSGRFMTLDWLYIDSLRKIVYEWDPANEDSLIRWNK